MPKIVSFTLIVVVSIMCFGFATNDAPAMDEPVFKIGRMVVCLEVSDREPVGIADTFSIATEKLYVFLEADDIEEDTEVTFVWYHNKKELAKVPLPLRQGSRWRTYASKRLNSLKGNWQVDLRDGLGVVRNSVSFKVE